jgi:hypothetical protein
MKARARPTKRRLKRRSAKREEEAGVADGNRRLAATLFSTADSCHELAHISAGDEKTERVPEEDEEIELVRVPVAEIAEIEDAKTLAGLLHYIRER